MNLFRYLFDPYDPSGLGARMRRKRHAMFLKLVRTLPRPVTILDVGGSESYWRAMGVPDPAEARITVLNLEQPAALLPAITAVAGDATGMPEFTDRSFDVVFSNSVIEHVGGSENQQKMAREVIRLGQRYFVQTPNYSFPIEPHFLFPGFQWLPESWRIRLVRTFALGWVERAADEATARRLVRENSLLTERQFRSLFPGAVIYKEHFLGLTKSFIACGGWDWTVRHE